MWDPAWEDVFRSQPWGKYPGEELIRFVARNFYRAPDRAAVHILEVGCGPGANLWFLAREGFSFTGIDGSATAIAQAEMRLDAECPGWRERGELHVGDIEHLPFPDGKFDAVIDCEAICCNSFDASVCIYDEIARVTKSGGKLFSRTFAVGSWGDGTGEKLGDNYWLCGEGPLLGKGPARFTAPNAIPKLIRGFSNQSVEKISRTAEQQRYQVSEVIIQGTKV